MGRPKKVYSIDNLTEKQEEIYEYIKDCVQKRNYPPSVRDICAKVGLKSTSSVFTYLNETGALAVITQIDEPPHQFKSLKEVLELTYQHEKLITSKINELVGRTFEEKDYSAFNFLQWYVAEQHEEEKLFSRILDKLNLLGEDGKGLFLVDKDLAELATASN